MSGYIESIRTNQEIRIQLRDSTITVKRAKFREHLLLAQLREEFANNMRRNMVTKAKAILRRYFLVTGIEESVIDSFIGGESMIVYLMLTSFNAMSFEIPMLKPNPDNGDGTQKPPAYDYEGRQWAVWVAILGESFGWAAKDVYDMYPEEVACYVQEAIVANYYKTEQERSLSKLSYKLDKTTSEMKFMPTPVPFWMSDGLMKKEPVIRTKKTMLPVGNVIDLTVKKAK